MHLCNYSKLLQYTIGILWMIVFVQCEAKVNAKVKCTNEEMRVEIPKTDYIHSIYLHGLKDYPIQNCQAKIDNERGLYVFNLSLINVFECGVTRMLNKLTGKKVYYHQIILKTVSTETPDEVIYVKCSVDDNRVITKRQIDNQDEEFRPEDIKEEEDLGDVQILSTTAPEPILGINVRQGGTPLTGGQLNVAPGTPLQMEIYLDQNSSSIYGLLVTYLQVSDTGTQEETIIYNGCSIDPYLFDNFNTVDGDLLTAKFRAFKFPDSTYVQFRGTVNVCVDKCKGVECSNGVIGYGRRKRRDISSLPPDPNKVFEITISSFLKVNFSKDDNQNDDFLTHKHKKFITGPENDTDNEREIRNTLKETDLSAKQVNLGQGSSIEEIQYTAIVEETTNTSTRNHFTLLLINLFVVINIIF